MSRLELTFENGVTFSTLRGLPGRIRQGTDCRRGRVGGSKDGDASGREVAVTKIVIGVSMLVVTSTTLVLSQSPGNALGRS